ncbi:hypothetical protein PQQ84_23440 [Paraburkholderia strydomiana]|uniref:hypothetical protein n=1 Tax=Paraburkholderia strydomiana TaxID=1245417 RepID=UPI0038B92F33
MLEFRERLVREVSACTCDRCGRRMTPDDPDSEWHERLSVEYRGGLHSIFGDGQAIRIDLCQHCVRDTLGPWLKVESGNYDNVNPSSDAFPLSALRGCLRHADEVVYVEAVNAAIADGVTPPMMGDPSSDVDPAARRHRSHWDYRVIEYYEAGEIWRELREVHYISDRGPGCSDTGACVRWMPEEGEHTAESILDRMRAALARPVLELSGSRQESDRQWLSAERLADPVRQPTSSRGEMEAKAIAAVFDGTTWLTALAVGRQHNPGAAIPRAVAIRWKQEGKIFSIDLARETLYPAYIFDELGNPIPEVAEILKLFSDYTPFRIASWFESTNGMLHGKRPRERLATDPSAVVEAARDHAQGSVHG